MNNSNNTNKSNNPAPAGSTSGSVSDTLKGYVNVAYAKGHEALETAKVLGHQVHEQINQASAQAKGEKVPGQASTHNASTGTQKPQMSQNHPTANSDDAFADLDKFNTQANQAASQASQTTNQASGHTGYKSSQSGL
ncbi:hypothetical protein BG003_007673 [Podila horticola]|nr:hypothetical protein BG003_007673 [Podila horticola]